MYRVIAFDPGGTTGWATYTAERVRTPEGKFEYYDEKWACGQLGPGDHHAELELLLQMQHTEDYRVVYETFEFRNAARPGLELVSREYIGVIKLWWQKVQRGLDGWIELTAQQPAQAVGKLSFTQDRHLKNMGLWRPGYRHANDAQLHLLYYLAIPCKRADIIKRMGK